MMMDLLVAGHLKEGQFQNFMGFMRSDAGISERKKIADLSKTVGMASPDQRKVIFKIAVLNIGALHSFLEDSNPVSASPKSRYGLCTLMVLLQCLTWRKDGVW